MPSKEPLYGLINRRKALNLSQKTVASKIGVSRSTYSGYENGYYEIPFKIVILLKKILKMTIFFYNLMTENRTKEGIRGSNRIKQQCTNIIERGVKHENRI